MGLADFDLNLLKSLNVLLTERHVTRAAAILGRSQPAMSNALRRLRMALGDELLVRSPNGLTLTARAEELQKPLRELLALIESAVIGAQPFHPQTASGLFRLSMPDRLIIAVMPPLLDHVQRLSPKTKLHVITADREHALSLLNENEIDLFVGWIDEIPAHLGSEFLLEERPFCVMRKEHPLLKPRAAFTMKAILSYPHLVVSAAGGRTQIFDDLIAQQGLERTAQVTLTNFTAVPHLLRQSDMIGVFTRLAAESFVASSQLAARPVPSEVGQIATHMIWHSRNHRDQRHLWMRDQIKNVYRALNRKPHTAAQI